MADSGSNLCGRCCARLLLCSVAAARCLEGGLSLGMCTIPIILLTHWEQQKCLKPRPTVTAAARPQGAMTHVDSAVRKTCIQVFERLASEWLGVGGGQAPAEDALPGFREYIMKQVGV